MDTSSWESYCLGRYLIDFPIKSPHPATDYKYADQYIEKYTGVDSEKFRKLLDDREKELRSKKRTRSQESFLIRQDELWPSKVLFTFWADENTESNIIMELYINFPNEKVMYKFSDKYNDLKFLQKNVEWTKTMISDFKYRPSSQIPTEPGFCLDNAIIATSIARSEEYTAYAKNFPNLPHVTLSITSYVTGNPEKPLLDRIPRVLSMFANLVSHMTTLRRGEHDLGPVKGQEYLIRGDDKGIRSYEFTWESVGKADSIEFPAMSIVLSTTHDTPDGKIEDAAFKSDEDALRFWDSVLSTFRLRPGAV